LTLPHLEVNSTLGAGTLLASTLNALSYSEILIWALSPKASVQIPNMNSILFIVIFFLLSSIITP